MRYNTIVKHECLIVLRAPKIYIINTNIKLLRSYKIQSSKLAATQFNHGILFVAVMYNDCFRIISTKKIKIYIADSQTCIQNTPKSRTH